MAVAQLLFSFRGRITRGKFWAVVGCLAVLAILLGGLQGWLQYDDQHEHAGAQAFYGELLLFLAYIFLIWAGIAIQAKRWHDLDRSAWMVFLGLIPIVCLFVFLYLGCNRGARGENRFGADPLGDPLIPARMPSSPGRLLWPIVTGVTVGAFVVALFAVHGVLRFNQTHQLLSDAQTTVARSFIEQDLRTALTTYHLQVGDYPSTAEGLQVLTAPPADKVDRWHGPYLDSTKTASDPWGHDYKYAYPGIHNPNGYDLWSTGPDGVDGTADDVSNW
jgi:general secretion pathway protein G